ncbi:MAG: hypothetical protein V3R94_06600 [Acidobacteriota bacterium]
MNSIRKKIARRQESSPLGASASLGRKLPTGYHHKTKSMEKREPWNESALGGDY